MLRRDWYAFCEPVRILNCRFQMLSRAGGDIQYRTPSRVATVENTDVSAQSGSEWDGEKQSFPSKLPWVSLSRRGSSLLSVNFRISTFPGYCKETEAMLRTAAQHA